MSDSLLSRLLRGWREIGARLGTFVGLLAICGILGAAVSLPLWLFSTQKRAYTIAVAAAAGAAIVAWAARRLARARSGLLRRDAIEQGAGEPRGLRRLLRGLAAILKAVLLLAALGATLALALRGRFLATLPAAAAFLAIAAWIGIGAGKRRAP